MQSMRRVASLVPALIALALAFFLGSSSTRQDVFVVGSDVQKKELVSLFKLLAGEKESGATRYTLIQEIIAKLREQGQIARMNLFLTEYVDQNPTDPYLAHYLFVVAENYRQAGATAFALREYSRVLASTSDILEEGRSIHEQSLFHLVQLEPSASKRREHFEELKARFQYKMVTPDLYYSWGRTAETLGLWDEALLAYNRFLQFPDPTVAGDPKASQRIRSLVDISQTDRAWVRQDLNELVAQVKRAVSNSETQLMETLRAKVGFFTLSWDNTDLTDTLTEAFDIRVFLKDLVLQANSGTGNDVRFEPALDPLSNDREAYLRSTGWNYRIPTWYFYFRRVEYPADPESNGAWEWAGVFFGEKL
jgi:tetratricopeptide (TPR) repeat protein